MDWSDGDFIFLSGYSFPDDLLSAVFDRARALKMGSKVVTLSLPEDKDKLYRKFHFPQCVWLSRSGGHANCISSSSCSVI